MGLQRKLESLIVVGGLLASSVASAAIYCCDDGGRRVCGDVLPAACYGQSYREMGNDGTLKRQVAAPPTREEIARRKADEEKRKADEQAQVKQRRLDEALLSSYTSVEEIDRRRDREIGEIERGVESTRQHQTELRARREKLQKDAEFYKGKPLPRDLDTGIQAIDKELASYETIFASKQAEIDALRKRFDADRARFIELKAGASASR
ncbi:MAG TPA: hypothetical protein VJ673_04375 [Aromatoleum sp.]|uniref:hypothetical protein n=1 Tax=Aromatoleum sp. TaxID=2307007 RepID=UPI002B48FE89|nr:hypothetical protein [Aromatoleum sp.]HJV24896.1 hypothetical protein [Aromatoleum sp.]